MATPFIAEIKMFAGNFAPRGYAFCNGQILSIAQNTALFSLVGTTYGGNGQTTFGLPNLQGRSPIHWGQGPGLAPVSLGEIGGSEQITLLQSQMPQHTHVAQATSTSSLDVSSTRATSATPVAGGPLARSVDANGTAQPRIYAPAGTATDTSLTGLNVAVSVTNGIAGGSQPVGIRNPYLGVSIIIALEGIYPSRN